MWKRDGGRELTCQISNEDFTCSYLVEVAHVNTAPWKPLCIEHCRARVNEHSAILLVEVFDCLCFRVELDSSRDGGCELLVGKVDSC